MQKLPPPPRHTEFKSPDWQFWFKLLFDALSPNSDVLSFKELHVEKEVTDTDVSLKRWHKVNSVSANYAMAGNETVLLVDATSANVTITLPFARIAGGTWTFQPTIRRMDASANTLTIAAATGDTVDGAASVTIAANRSRIFASDSATRWFTIGVN